MWSYSFIRALCSFGAHAGLAVSKSVFIWNCGHGIGFEKVTLKLQNSSKQKLGQSHGYPQEGNRKIGFLSDLVIFNI